MNNQNNYYDLKVSMDKPEQLNELVKQKPTFVRYHMNGCGHCVAMEEEWNKFVKEMSNQQNINIVNIEKSAADSGVSPDLTSKVEGYPTLILYTNNGKKQTMYEGERNADAFKSWLASQIKPTEGKKRSIRKRKTAKKINKRKNTKNMNRKPTKKVNRRKSKKRINNKRK